MVLAPLVLLSSLALAQAPAVTEPPSIVVSGEGGVKIAPDQAWVRIGAESRSKNSKDAQQQNAAVMTAVQQRVAAFGLSKDAIKTVGIDLQLEFDYRDGRQTPRGYVARNTIEVRVDDLSKLGDVLDAAVASGATNLHGLRFDVKDREKQEQQALQLAVMNAMEKAQAIASGALRDIDRILRIEESFVGRAPQPMMMERAAAARADASTPVEAGELEIRAQVRLTAAIK